MLLDVRRPARTRVLLLLALTSAGWPALARAQAEDRRVVATPTEGMALPVTALAGEHDARALLVNPAGLSMLRGSELMLAIEAQDPDRADSSGSGGGLVWAGPIGGGLLPRLGVGLGVEVLRPSRTALAPDLGTPVRLSAGTSYLLGRGLAVGIAWRRFFDDGRLDGVSTFDLGASARWGNHWAFGATLTDALAPRALGQLVSRRYHAEATLRPTGKDALELGLGGRIAERSGEVDVWARASARLARGLYAHLDVESRHLAIEVTSGASVTRSEGRDVRASLALELSFGGFGVTSWARGLRDERGDSHLLGGGLLVRSSQVEIPSVVAPAPHLERVDLSGALEGAELVSLLVRLRAIGRDPSAIAVALVFEDLSAGWAALRELRDELEALRLRGKKVYAFLVSGDTREYYLASVADKIYVDPAGGLSLLGVSATTLYWRGALDLIGVTAEVEKIAEYKSAPEQVTRTGPTVPAAAMRAELLDGVWAEVVSAIAASRRLAEPRVRELIDGGPYSAGDLAGDTALVDGVVTPERAAAAIVTDLGVSVDLATPPRERPASWRRPQIAVIHVHGDIVDGESQVVPLLGRRTAGGQTITSAIAAARADTDVGAIVLRIDSPGGSALASEQIAREVFATRGVKPILCSLGDVAASGGYFAAAGCDLIFAEPTTVTGSIGIFFGKADLSGLLAKLGITAVTELRGARADLGSMLRPYTDAERAALREKITYAYGRFVGAVAQGRGLSRAAVDDVGRGRVWTGAKAMEVGLVDRMGSIVDVLDEARRRMGVTPGEPIELVQLPQERAGLFARLGKLAGAARSESDPLGPLRRLPAAQWIEGLFPSLLVSPGGAQARLPFDWE